MFTVAVTLTELEQHIKDNVDPNDLVEYLNLSTESLVDRFKEEIEERMDFLVKSLELEDEDASNDE